MGGTRFNHPIKPPATGNLLGMMDISMRRPSQDLICVEIGNWSCYGDLHTMCSVIASAVIGILESLASILRSDSITF